MAGGAAGVEEQRERWAEQDRRWERQEATWAEESAWCNTLPAASANNGQHSL